MSDNFNKINKEANSFWSKYITDLEETTSENSTSDDNSAAPDDFDAMSDPMGAPAI